jgi:radical SAM superfamily enzyme YgiQ (UPF0313 family)
MSNLGLHSLYRIINGYPDFLAERFFWGEDSPLLSIESDRPLTDYAAVAFSVSFELDYLNVPNILREAGIPLYAAERDDSHPLIIAGGACITSNPMPLAPFFDCLCIGEAETLLPPLLEAIKEGSRREKLEALNALPGCYVPQLNEKKKVARRWAGDLNSFATSSVIITPDTEFGDLYLVEAERGCAYGCRFCLAGASFCPQRFRMPNVLLAQAAEGLKYKKRIGLVGPVVSSYPNLEGVLARLRQMGAGYSISSLRVKPLRPSLITELALGGVNSLSVAPEAGSGRLRQVIGKKIDEDDVLKAVDTIAAEGIGQLKLYFMLGLPSETDEDAEAIIDLSLKCKHVMDSHGRGGRLSLNVAPFVPKAGTPFQWLPMESPAVLKNRLKRLERGLQPSGIKVKGESIAWSEVQAVFSRGDSSLAPVLAAATENSLPGWRKAAREKGLDIDYYAHRRWPLETELPWGNIELGNGIERLKTELKKALGE